MGNRRNEERWLNGGKDKAWKVMAVVVMTDRACVEDRCKVELRGPLVLVSTIMSVIQRVDGIDSSTLRYGRV